MFLNIPRKCPNWLTKISEETEDCQRLLREMQYVKKFKYSLRVKHDINEVIKIFSSEDMENVLLKSQNWLCMNIFSGIFSTE